MKRLGKSLILVYIILTVLVLIAQPTMHKPATLERVDFKIKNELLKPRPRVVSDLEIRIRFNRSRPVVVQEDDRSRYITSDDDDRQLAFEMSGDNTTFKDTTFQLQDNIGSRRDVDVDTSSAGSSYSERFLSSQDRDFRQRDMESIRLLPLCMELGRNPLPSLLLEHPMRNESASQRKREQLQPLLQKLCVSEYFSCILLFTAD